MTSCPVCYEQFADSSATPRRLTCNHVVCETCIKNDYDGEFYCCPECFTEFSFSSIEDFSSVIDPSSVSEEDTTSASDNSNETEPFDSSASIKRARSICTHPGCTNKAIADDFCLAHTPHRHQGTLEKINMIAKDMANQDLTNLTTSGNRLHKLDKNRELKPEFLKEEFRQQRRIDLGEAIDLIERAKAIMFREPNILRYYCVYWWWM
jgi:hypothetical protein